MFAFKLKQDPTDLRDYLFKGTRYAVTSLPASIDLESKMSPIVDQSWLGSCTANAIASGLREYLELKGGEHFTPLSRLDLYWHEREKLGTIDEDSGAYIRDGMKIMQTRGCAPESAFPYVPETFKNRPSELADLTADKFKIRYYYRITSFDNLLHALAEELPVVLGMNVYNSIFNLGTDGIIPMPQPGEQTLGGHAVLACGYKTFPDGKIYVKIRNSWGTSWGINGYGWLPKEYIWGLDVTDMWTGSVNTPLASITFMDAINHFVAQGIFDSPDFWQAFENKYKAGQLTNADYEYVFLGFRKIASREM